MSLQAIYEEEILELIASAWDLMSNDEKVRWDVVKIAPEKWVQKQSLVMEFSKGSISIDRDEYDDVDMEGGAFDDGDGELDEYSTEASDFGFSEACSQDFDDESDEELDQENDGFWVVAVIGNRVLWYNHVEQGFNVSVFSSYGCIEKYESRKDDFDTAFKKVMSA